ncbi:MAG: pantoate--beta-alanine ligase [Actinobacteria bacterium]|uniref:pantoate--beta-alanine ligase (AMP-forming) n=1 Tax=freshwater metagenome TaxID=449393 RepID=A0A6J5YD42_9ZZZZ|nr:pantoate--beta-alanine ligase [Actinomycetota bacterium]MTA78408.1 pantoate--beta-alanine ligase [Actinomycetota bacterium]
MQVCATKSEFRRFLDDTRAAGRTVGLVPTMGALHAGHRSLMEAASAECDVVALTIFVNPLQFAPTEDLSKYPRPIERDLELAEAAGVGVVFTPTVEEMYPVPTATTVHLDGLTAPMEGAARPTHFDGVTTVVTKLFNIAGPCRAYFGEKDFQQLAVVRRMAADLDQPVEVVPSPIIREADGLAMSSRNIYLSIEDRAAALVLYRSLLAASELISAGERRASVVAAQLAADIASEPRAALEYAEVVDPLTLEPLDLLDVGTDVRLIVAARFATTRLLDNLGVRAS